MKKPRFGSSARTSPPALSAPAWVQKPPAPFSSSTFSNCLFLSLKLPCRFPKLLDIQDVDGQTALHVAASVGNAACVKLLLDAGADSTLRDAEGLTPLQVGFPRGCEWQQAEKSCFPECAEMLEAKWKELEERAREEMEELLQAVREVMQVMEVMVMNHILQYMIQQEL